MSQENPHDKQLQLPPAEAVDLLAMLAYQEGAIVSRTLVNRKPCTVTLFAFDAGQALSEHTAPSDAIVHVLDGTVALTVGSKAVTASTGQAVLLPANIPHALTATTRFKMLLTMVRG